MDLMDINSDELYFDQALPESVEDLIRRASEAYSEPEAEQMLMQAYRILPDHLSVHVALYRYYYYKHRLPEALTIAEITIEASARKLGFIKCWREATLDGLKADESNMAMVRYYLLALKGAGFICPRLGRHSEGILRLQKVLEMDAQDRLGAGAILEVIKHDQQED